MVSLVVNQGLCGSDWALAAVGAVEGAFGVETGTFVPLSGQQLIDCSGKATSCRGGTITASLDYLKNNKAMAEKDYPYKKYFARKGDCKYDETKSTSAMVKTHNSAQSGDIKMMKLALTHHPIVAVVNGSTKTFKLYA